MTQQERYDDAMFDFSQANYDSAIAKLTALLTEDPAYFAAAYTGSDSLIPSNVPYSPELCEDLTPAVPPSSTPAQ